jgi:hypothetical protein
MIHAISAYHTSHIIQVHVCRCLDELPQDLPVEELEQLWRDSFVFGLARSPHTRAVSAYRFLANKVKVAPECDDEAKKVRLWGCIAPGGLLMLAVPVTCW